MVKGLRDEISQERMVLEALDKFADAVNPPTIQRHAHYMSDSQVRNTLRRLEEAKIVLRKNLYPGSRPTYFSVRDSKFYEAKLKMLRQQAREEQYAYLKEKKKSEVKP